MAIQKLLHAFSSLRNPQRHSLSSAPSQAAADAIKEAKNIVIVGGGPVGVEVRGSGGVRAAMICVCGGGEC